MGAGQPGSVVVVAVVGSVVVVAVVGSVVVVVGSVVVVAVVGSVVVVGSLVVVLVDVVGSLVVGSLVVVVVVVVVVSLGDVDVLGVVVGLVVGVSVGDVEADGLLDVLAEALLLDVVGCPVEPEPVGEGVGGTVVAGPLLLGPAFSPMLALVDPGPGSAVLAAPPRESATWPWAPPGAAVVMASAGAFASPCSGASRVSLNTLLSPAGAILAAWAGASG